MIHIAGEYYLTADPLNYVLAQEKINQSEERKGEKYYVEVCYPVTLQRLLDKLVERKVKISISQAQSLKEVANDIQEIHNTIHWFCSKFKKEIEERMDEERFTVKVPVYRIASGKVQKVGEREIPKRWGISAIIEEEEIKGNEGTERADTAVG